MRGEQTQEFFVVNNFFCYEVNDMKTKTTTITVFSQPEPTHPELGIDLTPAWDSSKRLRRMFPGIDIDNPPPELARKVKNAKEEIRFDVKANPRLYLEHCEGYCKVDEARAAQLRRELKTVGRGIMCNRTTQELQSQYSDSLTGFYHKAFTYMQRRAQQDDFVFLDPRIKSFLRRPYACEGDGFDVCAVEVTREGRTFYVTGKQKRIFAPHVETTVARFRPIDGPLDYRGRLDRMLEPKTMPAVTEYRDGLKFLLSAMSGTVHGEWLRWNSSVDFSDEELAAERQQLLKLAETLPVVLDYIGAFRCLSYEDHLEWKARPRFYQPGEQS